MTKELQDRQARIKRPAVAALGQQATQRVYAPSAPTIYIARYVDEAAKKIWAHEVQYSTTPPVEDSTKVVGDFVEIFTFPMVQVVTVSPFVSPLLNATTLAQITENPPIDPATGEENEEKRAIFDAAILAEAPNLKSRGYPLPCFEYLGKPTILCPLWMDPNVDFVDEQQEMDEGGGI